jgi:hypothetical protein
MDKIYYMPKFEDVEQILEDKITPQGLLQWYKSLGLTL